MELKNHLDKTLTVARFEVLKNIKRKRIYIMIILSALLMLLPTLVRISLIFTPGPDAKSFLTSELSTVGTLIVLTGLFFASDSIVSEYEKRTGYILFPNPVTKEVIMTGKFLASYAISLVFVLVYYLYVGLESLYYFGEVPIEFFYSIGYAVLYLLAIIAFTYIFSAAMNSTMGATILVFFLYFMILSSIVSIHSLIGIEPFYILTYYSETLTEVFNPPAERITKMNVGDFTLYIFHPDLALAPIVMITYTIISLILTWWIFKNKELKQ